MFNVMYKHSSSFAAFTFGLTILVLASGCAQTFDTKKGRTEAPLVVHYPKEGVKVQACAKSVKANMGVRLVKNFATGEASYIAKTEFYEGLDHHPMISIIPEKVKRIPASQTNEIPVVVFRDHIAQELIAERTTNQTEAQTDANVPTTPQMVIQQIRAQVRGAQPAEREDTEEAPENDESLDFDVLAEDGDDEAEAEDKKPATPSFRTSRVRKNLSDDVPGQVFSMSPGRENDQIIYWAEESVSWPVDDEDTGSSQGYKVHPYSEITDELKAMNSAMVEGVEFPGDLFTDTLPAGVYPANGVDINIQDGFSIEILPGSSRQRTTVFVRVLQSSGADAASRKEEMIALGIYEFSGDKNTLEISKDQFMLPSRQSNIPGKPLVEEGKSHKVELHIIGESFVPAESCSSLLIVGNESRLDGIIHNTPKKKEEESAN